MISMSCASVYGLSLTEIKRDLIRESKLTILQNATPVFFYDVKNGRSKGGGITTLWNYREILRADVGWANDLEGTRVGDALGGASVRIDNLISQIFPELKELVNVLVPEATKKFWDKLSIGYGGGWDFDNGEFVHGFYSGVELKF